VQPDLGQQSGEFRYEAAVDLVVQVEEVGLGEVSRLGMAAMRRA
jgi:hypothetical protein